MVKLAANQFNWVITRPQHQAKAWEAYFLSKHIPYELFPLLEIVPKQEMMQQSFYEYLNGSERIVITSPNCIYHAPQPLSTILKAKQQCIYTMGQGTTAALQQLGIHPLYSAPVGASSETITSLADFRDVKGIKISILSGQGGRQYLVEKLQQAKAQVIKFPLYERKSIYYSPDQIQVFLGRLEGKTPLFLMTSVTSINALMRCVPQGALNWLKHQPMILISNRIYEHARALGFENIKIVPSMDICQIVQMNPFMIC